MVSADYPGAISRGLKNILGKDIQTIFAQGAGGSAKTRFYDEASLNFKAATLEELDGLGYEAAEKITALVKSNKMQRLELNISGLEKEFILPYDRTRFLSQSQLLKLATTTDATVEPIEKYWAAQIYETNRTATTVKGYIMHVTKLKLNADLAILGLSGEVTGEMGALVKKLFPVESIICLGYCTKTDAYIPTAAMLPEGGYEADAVGKYFGRSAPFSPDIDKIMQQEFKSKCPICKNDAKYTYYDHNARKLHTCNQCGSFGTTERAEKTIMTAPKDCLSGGRYCTPDPGNYNHITP